MIFFLLLVLLLFINLLLSYYTLFILCFVCLLFVFCCVVDELLLLLFSPFLLTAVSSPSNTPRSKPFVRAATSQVYSAPPPETCLLRLQWRKVSMALSSNGRKRNGNYLMAKGKLLLGVVQSPLPSRRQRPPKT